MVAQFLAGGSVYILLLLLTLGEEFKHCPAPLQSLCCWVHETKLARTVLTLTAISVNFGVASADIVSGLSSPKKVFCPIDRSFPWCFLTLFFLLPSFLSSFLSRFLPSQSHFLPSFQLWCDSLKSQINRSDSSPAWPTVNICTHPEVSSDSSVSLSHAYGALC